MNDKPSIRKPWGGRFNSPTDAFVESFTASVTFDQRLAMCDIRGSIAHVTMLSETGIITEDEKKLIVDGLEAIKSTIKAGDFTWSIALEDVHMNIEHALVEAIGEVGKKLHTARSRNDQVATDIRLYLRAQTEIFQSRLLELMTTLIELAEREATTLMPGYTHLQAAQPITFGHHMLAWFEMLIRDYSRFSDCKKRLNSLPLGAGALAGTTFPINRQRVAELLKFDTVAENSLDAVSDRDFALEFSSVASILMIHYSRMAEELVLWNSQAFAFVEIDDAFCTGSSMMPQKKNPDVPELLRGKSGRVVGNLMALLTLMKSQPLAYNKDNQEDKEPIFDTIDTVNDCTRALTELIPSLRTKKDRMRAAAAHGFITATDLADHLVRLGLPFRDAHEVVGKAVNLALSKDCQLHELSLAEFRTFDERLDESVYNILDMDNALDSRKHWGGTAPLAVREACARARNRLKDLDY